MERFVRFETCVENVQSINVGKVKPTVTAKKRSISCKCHMAALRALVLIVALVANSLIAHS